MLDVLDNVGQAYSKMNLAIVKQIDFESKSGI